MAEKLRVFKNLINQTTTDITTTINIDTNNEIEQSVINRVKIEATDPNYLCNIKLNLNGEELSSTKSSKTKNIASLEVIGEEILYEGHSIDADIESLGDDLFHIERINDIVFQTKMDAIFFPYSGAAYSIKDTSTDDRTTISAIPYASIVPNIISTTLPYVNYATSAFGWIDSGVKKYARCYSNIIYTYDSNLNLLQTSATIPETTYGACTDGTYFYAKGGSSNSTLYRLNTSNGTLATSITMNISFPGQTTNAGAYLLYYDGFVYSKQAGSSTVVYKVNVVTGEVTTLTVPSGSTYSAGGIITVAANGIPYLVEHCNGRTIVIDLSTFTVVPETWSTTDYLGTSTEYGNLALEVSAGVVAFFYNTVHLFFDTNTMTRTNAISNGTSHFPPTLSSSNDSSSIANIPLYSCNISTLIERNITYNIYADGKKITEE